MSASASAVELTSSNSNATVIPVLNTQPLQAITSPDWKIVNIQNSTYVVRWQKQAGVASLFLLPLSATPFFFCLIFVGLIESMQNYCNSINLPIFFFF